MGWLHVCETVRQCMTPCIGSIEVSTIIHVHIPVHVICQFSSYTAQQLPFYRDQQQHIDINIDHSSGSGSVVFCDNNSSTITGHGNETMER